MTRKPPYKPLVHQQGIFTQTHEIIEQHGKAMDFKDREALIQPDKVYDNTKRWTLTKSEGQFFKVEPRREIDEYDIFREKYFKSTARGIGTMNSFVRNTMRAVSTTHS